jgi:hypothetical protein
MAQVRDNPKTEAMKAKLPGAAVQAIIGAMATHKELANKLISDEATRGVFLDVVYELLKQDGASGLFGAAAWGLPALRPEGLPPRREPATRRQRDFGRGRAALLAAVLGGCRLPRSDTAGFTASSGTYSARSPSAQPK